jgi:hypothetical protein
MPRFEFCIPTVGKAVPAGAGWFHEVKYDGYRLRVERDGDRVRLITRAGHDWTKRFPWITEAALRNRRKQFVIDGEAVILGVDGVADFQRAAFRPAERRGAVLCLRRAGGRRRGCSRPSAIDAEDQSGSLPPRPAGRDLYQSIRDRRHWS